MPPFGPRSCRVGPVSAPTRHERGTNAARMREEREIMRETARQTRPERGTNEGGTRNAARTREERGARAMSSNEETNEESSSSELQRSYSKFPEELRESLRRDDETRDLMEFRDNEFHYFPMLPYEIKKMIVGFCKIKTIQNLRLVSNKFCTIVDESIKQYDNLSLINYDPDDWYRRNRSDITLRVHAGNRGPTRTTKYDLVGIKKKFQDTAGGCDVSRCQEEWEMRYRKGESPKFHYSGETATMKAFRFFIHMLKNAYYRKVVISLVIGCKKLYMHTGGPIDETQFLGLEHENMIITNNSITEALLNAYIKKWASNDIQGRIDFSASCQGLWRDLDRIVEGLRVGNFNEFCERNNLKTFLREGPFKGNSNEIGRTYVVYPFDKTSPRRAYLWIYQWVVNFMVIRVHKDEPYFYHINGKTYYNS